MMYNYFSGGEVMSIKNIVFDMGGVLIDFDPKRALSCHFQSKDEQKLVSEAVFKSAEWLQMDKGTMSVDDSLQKMCSRLPSNLHSEVRKMVLEHEKEMPPIKEMEPIVKALKNKGYKIYLLSNVPAWFYEFKKSVPAFKYFDGMVISSDYHELKPGKELYNILFDKYSLIPNECFFIDDTISNIQAAKDLGMETFLFDTKDFSSLKETLNIK